MPDTEIELVAKQLFQVVCAEPFDPVAPKNTHGVGGVAYVGGRKLGRHDDLPQAAVGQRVNILCHKRQRKNQGKKRGKSRQMPHDRSEKGRELACTRFIQGPAGMPITDKISGNRVTLREPYFSVRRADEGLYWPTVMVLENWPPAVATFST